MGTVHIEAEKGEIAKRVLMPGDPNRAKYIAEKYLENPVLVNQLRGELAFTGKYKGVDVTIFSSGMGIGSMGIYSYSSIVLDNVSCLFLPYQLLSLISIKIILPELVLKNTITLK